MKSSDWGSIIEAASVVRTNLSIEQAGQPTLDFTAEYDSRAFDKPLYYAFRFGLEIRDLRWEVQFTHQKIYLADPPAEVRG